MKQFDTSRCLLSPLYKERIRNLHETKLAINREKLELEGGYYNTDDHGFIPLKTEYKPHAPHPSGVLFGCRDIGKGLAEFLSYMPTYIHEDSAIATCWIGSYAKFQQLGMNPDQTVPASLRATWEKYRMSPGYGGMNHLGPDMKIGLDLGWGGLLEKIRYYRAFNDPADTSFYDGEEALVAGIIDWVARHAAYARELAAAEGDPEKKRNYLKIADMNEWLTEHAPRTFREACQFLAHFQSVDRTYFMGGALSQLDELLRPYYERDVAAGELTDEEAVWILASLFYNDTHYSQIGGVTPDGSRDLASRLSFLVLDAMHEIHIPINIAVRVWEGMDDALAKRAVEYILEDGSGADFSCAKGIIEGYVANGYPEQLGRMRAKVGCNWVALPGIEYPLQDVTRCNFAWTFVHSFDEMMAGGGEPSLDRLWENFAKHIAVQADAYREGYDLHIDRISASLPEIVLNLFCHGPIERGLNCAEGGVDIRNLNVDGIALATVADSFAAIEQRVVNEKRITWRQLYEALKADWEGAEELRLMCKNIDRFGNPASLAEKWAMKIRDVFVYEIKKELSPKHRLMLVPGLFSHGEIYAYAKELPATPNGRRKNDPISHSSEPDPGFARGLRTFSPSLKSNAVAKAQAGYGNSAPLHLDIDTGLVNREGGVDAILALIKGHNELGGTLINMNCVSKKDILEAHADPSTHPDLVVRVTGYSAFFSSLSKDYRQQVVDRFLAAE